MAAMPSTTAPTGSPPWAPGVRRRFQAGGTVGEGAFYVERPADGELPDALRQGELCYVLATRQIGKSRWPASTLIGGRSMSG
jgi:hypothetical protein